MRTLTCLAIVLATLVAGCAGDLLPLPETVADIPSPSPKAVATATDIAEPTEAAPPSPTATDQPRTPVPTPTSTAVDIDKTATPVELSPTVATRTGTVTPTTTTPESATPIAEPTVPATPRQAPRETGIPVMVGDEIDFPAGVAVIISVGCAECEGGVSGLIRVHKDPNGELLVTPLLSVDSLDLPPRSVVVDGESADEEPYILGPPAINSDGGELVVGICTRGHCGPNTNSVTSDAQVAVFRSVDGGVKWSKMLDLDGAL